MHRYLRPLPVHTGLPNSAVESSMPSNTHVGRLSWPRCSLLPVLDREISYKRILGAAVVSTAPLRFPEWIPYLKRLLHTCTKYTVRLC